jgi:hypothetical protein
VGSVLASKGIWDEHIGDNKYHSSADWEDDLQPQHGSQWSLGEHHQKAFPTDDQAFVSCSQ